MWETLIIAFAMVSIAVWRQAKRRWPFVVTYISAVLGLMFADGSLGWDDLLIGIIALPVGLCLLFLGHNQYQKAAANNWNEPD
jgi:hypothetical protein